MDSKVIWSIIAIVNLVILALATVMMVRGYGDQGIPVWFVELQISYFWHSLVFLVCVWSYSTHAKHHVFLRGQQLFIGWLFTFYVAVVLILRFWLDVYYMIAYPVPVLFCIYIPLYVYLAVYPVYAKRADFEKINPNQLFQLTKKSPQVLAFLQCFAAVKVYAYQIERKHREAKCVLMHRRHRDEREGLVEDIVMEVTIDMDANPPEIIQEELTRYLFLAGDEGSAVIHIETDHDIRQEEFEKPLDNMKLIQIDSAFERYPLLGELPLVLTTVNGAYREVQVGCL